MTTPSRKQGGKAPNDRSRPQGRELPPDGWNSQTDETTSQRTSERAIAQADGEP